MEFIGPFSSSACPRAARSPLDQAVDQLTVAHAARFPQLGIHADGRKSRHGVDLVDENRLVAFAHEEIYPRQAPGFYRLKGPDAQLAHGLLGGWRDARLE